MVLKKTVKIDKEKCDGCGVCIPHCAEGALQIVNGKAKIISEKYCDGLGACLRICPQGAIAIEEKESEGFNKEAAEEQLKKDIIFSSTHSSIKETSHEKNINKETITEMPIKIKSVLSNWPVQLMLVPPRESFLDDTDLLIVADCVPFAYANFHKDLLQNKAVVIGCPKLDDIEIYREKLNFIFQQSKIRSITVVNMEVPCCFGLLRLVKEALTSSGKNVPLRQEIISIKGKRLTPNH